MPDLKQALKDFVATSNSGKYSDEKTLMSKFPELKGYDVKSLRDYVATSNSGKYKEEDELNSKFPEFFSVKKKDQSESTYRKNLLELVSKPKKQGISLVTEPQKKVSVSESSSGVKNNKVNKVKTASSVNKNMKQFTGFGQDDLNKMKSTNKPEANVIQQPSENKMDGFLDYLSDTTEIGILNAEKFLMDTPELVYDLAAKANPLTSGIENSITEATGITPFKRMQKKLGFENISSGILESKISDLNKRIQEKSLDYGVDPFTAIKNGRYGDAAKLIIGSTIQSAPMMGIAIGTGGGVAGLASIGILTSSGKYKENQEDKEMSQNQRLLNAVGSGVLESTLGHFFSGASGAVAKKILKDKGTEAGSKIISNSFKGFVEKNIMKNPLVALVGEIFEETAVEAGNQLNDYAVGIRTEFDGNSAINAGISSLGFGGVNTVSVYGAKGYISANKYSQIKKTNKAISRLQNEITNEGISEESRKIFQIKSEELIQKNKQLLGSEIEKLKTLSQEDKALLNKTNSIVEDVMSSIDTIKEDKTLSPEAKKIAVSEIYKDYLEAEKVKKKILSKLDNISVDADFKNFNGVPLDFDVETSGVSSLAIGEQERLNKQALDYLNKELNPTGMEQVDITKEMVSKKASELYDEEQKDVLEKEIVNEDVVDEVVQEPIAEEVKDEENVIDGVEKENLPNKLNEKELPGYDRMMSEVSGIIEKSEKRRVGKSKVADNVMSYVTGSKVYEDATDVQRESLVREVRSMFDINEKKSPSANRILGNIQDVKKITISEKTALKKQITDKAKGARDAVKAQKEIAQQLAIDVKELASSGTITAKQAANVVNAFSKTNVFNDSSIDKFTSYATKIFEDADYQDKVDNALGLSSSVKRKLKSKDIEPELRDLAKKLVSINPKKIDDIDSYLDVISNVNDNIKGSTTRGSKLNIAEGIDKNKLSEYVNTEIEKYNDAQLKEIEESFYQNTGLNPKDFTYEEIQEMMYEPKSDSDKLTKYDELDLRSKINKASEQMKSIVSNSIENDSDSFTGEDVEITGVKKEEVKKLLDVDVETLSKQDSLLYIDILNDIIVNGNSNKAKLFLIKLNAINAAKESRSKFSAKKVKLFGLNLLGRAWNEQIASLPLVSESMFKSIEKGEEFLSVIGFDNIRKGTNKATREVNSFFKEVSDSYRKSTPNGQDFTSKFNDHERGMTAFMMMSTDESDFNRNKRLIEGSINNLSKGDEDQVKIAKSHKEVYDKILKDSKSVEDVTSKADAVNVDAVNKFIDFNKSKYAEKEIVSKSIYNSSLLDKENYTATTYKLINPKDVKIDDIDAFDSSILSSKEKIYDKKSGTFIESKKPTTVKDGSFISLDFLSDNERKMKESLVDTYTAGDIQFMKSFINSDYMNDIIPNKKDRDVFIDRIKEYVKIKRNRQIDISPEAAKEFSRLLDKTSRLAVSRSLAGVGQAINQTVPVATSTLINSQRLDLIDATNSDWNSLINNSGYDIANRGLESASDYAAFSKILEQANENKLDKVVDLLFKGQEFWLKTFLGKPDVFIARASWISFYKKGLQAQGKSIDINPKDHEINDEAARYAQAQVDRQQNPSDHSLEGKWLSSKNSGAKISRAIMLPFAKFALNQKSRMYNDARILSSFSSSSEDKMKSALSLIGLSAEMYMFSLVSGYVKDLVESGIDYAMDYEEDEKDVKENEKRKKESAILNFTSNVISPFPVADFLFQNLIGDGIDKGQDYFEIPKEERIDVKAYSDEGMKKYGTIGISFQGAKDIPEFESLINEGKFKGSRGVEKQISKEDLEVLRALRTPFYLNQAGLLPREVSYSIKRAVKIAKERADDKKYKEKRKTF